MHPVASNQPSGPGPEPQPALPHPNPPRDEVDQIVQAWAAQRSDLDTSPMQVFSRITRLSRHLDFARREAFAAHGLEPSPDRKPAYLTQFIQSEVDKWKTVVQQSGVTLD